MALAILMTVARIPDAARITLSQDLLAHQLAGELVILDLKSGEYFSLDEVGVRVWQLLQTPNTIAAMCETIVREYDVDARRCADDLHALVTEMKARGLVDVTEDAA